MACAELSIVIIVIILQVNALLETLELKDSAQRKGHFAQYNCLVLGHTKYNGVQRVYCNQFPAKSLYGHRVLPVRKVLVAPLHQVSQIRLWDLVACISGQIVTG